jgi:6-pyruvoyl-tetrahydropterin synthase
MVIDFGVLKKVIDEIKADWDHGVLLPSEIAAEFSRSKMTRQRKIVDFVHNPTAENMAEVISNRVTEFLSDEWPGVEVYRVRVQETETGVAEYLP